MKSVFLLLPFLLCAVQFCKGQQIDDEHQKKAEKIIERVASGKELPAGIISKGGQAEKDLSSHFYGFGYWAKRSVNKMGIDSVLIHVALNDSLHDIEFHENYHSVSDTITMYHYNIENGEITYAFCFKPYSRTEIESLAQIADSLYRIDNNVSHFPWPEKIDSTSMINKKDFLWRFGKAEFEKHRERYRVLAAFYEPKLLKSIDELHDILFK
jgi:hypothetical protein